MKNLSFDILNTAEVFPDKIAIASEQGDVSYRALRLTLVSMAANMRKAGIDHTSCVAVLARSSHIALYSILALGLLGARWIQANPAVRKYPGLKLTHLLHPVELELNSERLDPDVQVVTLDKTWVHASEELIKQYAPEIKGNRSDDDTWYVAQSSGTTGNPKLMALSYLNYWMRNKKAPLTHDFNPVITCNLFPPLSGPWVSYNLRTLELQGTLVFSHKFEYLLEANVQKVFGSPKQFEVFFKNNPNVLTKRLPIAHVAGATISKRFAQQILQRFELIHNFYGGTEVGGISRKLIRNPEEETRCVGRILDGNKVQVVDETFQPVASNVEGLIGVQNNIMVTHYLSDDEATDTCFRDGWFYSGDIGYVNDEGELFVTGRQNDVLNVGGVKVNPSEIDEVLMSSSAVEDALTFSLTLKDSAQLLALVVKPTDLDIKVALGGIQIAQARLPKFKRVTGICFVSELPRNENGKPVRKDAYRVLEGKTLYNLV